MTDWRPFFQILAMHRAGYIAKFPYDVAVDHPNLNDMARALHMLPMPEGPGISDLAQQWLTENTA